MELLLILGFIFAVCYGQQCVEDGSTNCNLNYIKPSFQLIANSFFEKLFEKNQAYFREWGNPRYGEINKEANNNASYDYCLDNTVYLFNTYEEMNIIPNLYLSNDLDFDAKLLKKLKSYYNVIEGDLNTNTTFSLSPEIDIFFTTVHLSKSLRDGSEFSCLMQSSNHILEKAHVSLKVYLSESVQNYQKFLLQNKIELSECSEFISQKIHPTGYILQDPDQCKAIIDILRSPSYKKKIEEFGVQHILKNQLKHRTEGIELLTTNYTSHLLSQVDNLNDCKHIPNFKDIIIQEYVESLPFKNRKFEIRCYLLVASTFPFVTLYRKGLVRVAVNPFDRKNDTVDMLIINYQAARDQINGMKVDDTTVDGLTKEEINNIIIMPMEELEKYLLEIDYNKWKDGELHKKIQRVLFHLSLMLYKKVHPNPTNFEIFGLDIIIDTNGNFQILEVNVNSSFKPTSSESPSASIFHQTLLDTFEVVVSIQKKRVNNLIKFFRNELKKISKSIFKAKLYTEEDITKFILEWISSDSFHKKLNDASVNNFDIRDLHASNQFKVVLDMSNKTNKGIDLLDKQCVDQLIEVVEKKEFSQLFSSPPVK